MQERVVVVLPWASPNGVGGRCGAYRSMDGLGARVRLLPGSTSSAGREHRRLRGSMYLLGTTRIAVGNLILGEVLQGVRDEREFQQVRMNGGARSHYRSARV